MKLVFIFVLAIAFACVANAAFNPPVYRQGDKRWGSKQLGFGSYTIARKGCFLTCHTSMIASQGIKVDGQTPDPDNMNEYFKDNDQFLDGGMLNYKAPQEFGFKYNGKISSRTTAIENFNSGKFVVCHVENGSHWVLVTSITSTGYNVMDPAGVRTSYKFSEVPEFAIYTAPAGYPGTKSSVDSAPETEDPADEPEDDEPETETPQGAFNPPVYLQGDKKWGSERLGFGSYTIARKGCFLTCQASMIASQGIKINGETPDPENMNEWAMDNDQFDGGNLLYKAPNKFGFKYEGKTTSKSEMKNAFNEGKFVLLHVNNYSHWVLVTSISSSEYQVMDPAGNRDSFKFSEAPEAAIYTAPAGKPGTSSA